METRTYIETVFIPECTEVHHTWSHSGEVPEVGAPCECGACVWEDFDPTYTQNFDAFTDADPGL